MGGLSPWHILLVLVIVLILFGAGKLPQVMGDVAKGIKSFRAGLKEGAPEKPGPGPEAGKTGASETRREASSGPGDDGSGQG